jgi:hypothetical protein
LAVCLFHGLLLLNDGRYLDGTYFTYHIETGNYGILQSLFASWFMHPWAWLAWPLSGKPYAEFALKLVEFLSLLAISLLSARLARRLLDLEPAEETLVGCLVAAFPVYVSIVMSSTVIFIFPIALFYSAWAIYLEGKRPWNWLAFPVLALAFIHSSLLVYHYVFVLALLLHQGALLSKDPSFRSRAKEAAAQALRHLPLILLPILFFLVRAAMLPPSSNYNAIVISLPRLLTSFAVLVREGFLSGLLGGVGGNPFLLALLLAFPALHLFSASRRDGAWRKTWLIALAGGIALAAAIFPYAAVARGVPSTSLGSRYFILGGLGAGLVLLAVIRTLPATLKDFRLPLALALIAGLGAAGIDNYLLWQGRWAKDLAAIRALGKLPPPPAGTAVVWEDGYHIGSEVYRSFELNWFMAKAWGGQSWYGFDAADTGNPSTLSQVKAVLQDSNGLRDALLRKQDIAQDFAFNGCFARVTIRPRGERSPGSMIGRQYLTRRFEGPALEAWLGGLVEAELSQAVCEERPKAP